MTRREWRRESKRRGNRSGYGEGPGAHAPGPRFASMLTAFAHCSTVIVTGSRVMEAGLPSALWTVATATAG